VSLKGDAFNAWQLLLIKSPDCSRWVPFSTNRTMCPSAQTGPCALQHIPNYVLAGAWFRCSWSSD